MKKLTIWDNNGETWDRFTIMEPTMQVAAHGQ